MRNDDINQKICSRCRYYRPSVTGSFDHGICVERSIVRRMLARFDPHYLRLTREQPWHPLYLPDNTRPSRWYSEGYSKRRLNKNG